MTSKSSILQEELRHSKAELLKVSDQIKKLFDKKRNIENRVDELKAELEILNEKGDVSSKFDRDDFSWSKTLMEKLRSIFQITEFRSHQKVAINATMSGVDLMLVMPTGGGKSLCFQLPAILSDGVTLVVSPLISLMNDQLQGLQQLEISTKVFNSQTSKDEIKIIFDAMLDSKSNLKMLYVTPEKLAKSKRLMSQLEKMYRAKRFARLVIDEVHCCSEWGHDFRTDYKFLGVMKTQYPTTPIIGLTATATASVIVDIQKMLNIVGCLVLRDSYFRPNLRYSVVDYGAKEKMEQLVHLIKTRYKNQSGIVYCLSIRDCEDVAVKLKDNGIDSCCYHSQMDSTKRSKVQTKWSENHYQVIVATVAFGMGINKLDVRFVIHHSLSKSVENYYQETGRAGRDGEAAECILFFNMQDSFRCSSLMFTEKNGLKNVYNMLKYALDHKTCRKKIIAMHFGDSDVKESCGNCDNCDDSESHNDDGRKTVINVRAKSILHGMVKLLDHAACMEERMTAIKLLDALYSKGNLKLRMNDIPTPQIDRGTCEHLLGQLLIDGYLMEDFHFTPYSTISYIVVGSDDIPNNEISYEMYPPRKFNANNALRKRKGTSNSSSNVANNREFNKKIKEN